MNSAGTADHGRDRKHHRAEEDERPPDEQSRSHDRTPLSHANHVASAVSPRLLEFLPRATQNVSRSLTRRGLPAQVVEDLVQEVAYYAVRGRLDPATPRELERWAYIVANHRATNWLRKQSRDIERMVELDDDLLLVGAEDVSGEVHDRVFLETVAQEFANLRAEDREIIAAAMTGAFRGDTKRERDRFGLKLHRARLRLEARVRGWLVALPLRFRVDDLLSDAQHLASVAAVGALGISAVLGAALGVVVEAKPSAAAERVVTIDVEGIQMVPVATRSVPVEPAHVRPDRAIRTDGPGSPPTTTAPLVPYQRVEVDSPSGRIANAERREAPPKAPLLCLTDMPVFGTNCVAHPFRQ